MSRENRYLAYRVIVLLTLTACLAAGLVLLVAFLQSTIAPASASGARILTTNYWGSYLGGTAGCLFLTWAFFLGGSLFYPERGRSAGATSAAGLLLLALLNLAARFSGDFFQATDWQRFVSLSTTVMALAFIWLTPASKS